MREEYRGLVPEILLERHIDTQKIMIIYLQILYLQIVNRKVLLTCTQLKRRNLRMKILSNNNKMIIQLLQVSNNSIFLLIKTQELNLNQKRTSTREYHIFKTQLTFLTFQKRINRKINLWLKWFQAQTMILQVANYIHEILVFKMSWSFKLNLMTFQNSKL